jgi:acylphosphatase
LDTYPAERQRRATVASAPARGGVDRGGVFWQALGMTDMTLTASITGRVQGVAFRAWTQAEARARGLTGWVRNEADGSVSALLHGPRDAVAAMVAALHDGPGAARVDSVKTASTAPPEADGFEITG